MRRFLPILLVAGFLIACTEPSPDGTTSTAPAASTSEPSPEPDLPAGIPPYFESDVPGQDVPPLALIPLTAELTGSWTASTSAGEAILVAWQLPGPDPFRLERGVATWRRFDDGGAPWRPVWGQAFAKKQGLLGIDATIADVSGDGSDDALIFAGTGGSGGCGTYFVLDPTIGETLFQREVCDTTIAPSPDPPGLLIVEAVYEPDDPHCCPSAMRETVLTYGGGSWAEASRTVVPAS